MSRSSGGTQTTRTEIDPDVKTAYLQNLQQARNVAAALPAREFAGFNPLYQAGEAQLTNLGLTPFTGEEIAAFQNPYEQMVVQNTLQDIEDQRRMGQLAEAQRATAARAFGGSRQGVQQALTNQAALRQAATAAANLRQQGFGEAARLAQTARGLGRQGAMDVMGLGAARQAFTQQQLDAMRGLGLERLGISQAGLSLNLPNLGMTASTPLYQNRAAGALGGALGGAQLGQMAGFGAGTGAALGGLLGLL
jgi:hypothetical protein